MRRPKEKWIVKNVWIIGVLFLIAIILLQMNVIFDLKREAMVSKLETQMLSNEIKSDTIKANPNKY
jgi:competence protein ComGC